MTLQNYPPQCLGGFSPISQTYMETKQLMKQTMESIRKVTDSYFLSHVSIMICFIVCVTLFTYNLVQVNLVINYQVHPKKGRQIQQMYLETRFILRLILMVRAIVSLQSHMWNFIFIFFLNLIIIHVLQTLQRIKIMIAIEL